MDALIRLKALLREQTDEWTKDESMIMKKRLLMPRNPAAQTTSILDSLGPNSPSVRADISIAKQIAASPFINLDDPTPRIDDLLNFDGDDVFAQDLITPRMEALVEVDEPPLSGIRPPNARRSGDMQSKLDQLRQVIVTDLERRNSISSISTDERTRSLKTKSVSFVDDPTESPFGRPQPAPPPPPPAPMERRVSIVDEPQVAVPSSNSNNFNNNAAVSAPPEEKPAIVRRQGSVSSSKSEPDGLRRSTSGLRRSVSEVQEAIPSADELTPLNAPKAAIQGAMTQMAASDWVDQRQGVDMLRRIVKFHPEVILDNTRDIWPLLIPLVDNLRSYLARLAIRCLNEMFESIGPDMGPAVKLIAPMLLKKFAESNAFIKDEADQAIVSMIEHAPPTKTLDALLNVSADKAAVVRAQVAECLSIFVQVQIAVVQDPKLLQRLSQTLQKYLGEGKIETRQSTKAAIGFLKQNLPPHLHKHMKEVLV